MPLVAGRRSFGAMVAATVGGACYAGDDIELFHDVAGRLAMTLENGRLYKTIHDRDRQKDEFLAMLSHELRNPLGAIAGAVRLLETLEWSDERAARAREVVARQSTHLTRIVDDLLDVARLTAGRITLIARPVDLAETVARAIDTLRVAGSLEHHQVTVTVVPVTVEGDQARLQQVVTNLVVNALKYTDRGGGIEVQVAEEEGDAVVRVRDTGIGISEEVRPRLFELFAQGDQALDRAQGGLGIGLALVRHIIELHGGRVDAWSDGPGRGSVFTIRLPRRPAVPAAAGDRPPPLREVASLRILVVEDNPDSRDMLRILLELAGHEVLEARDGPEGLRLAIDTQPAVALVDLGLPGLDGLELASRIRAAPAGKAIVLVAVTGYGQASDRRRALEAGFDLHLTKPIDVERLHEVLALAVRRDEGATGIENSV